MRNNPLLLVSFLLILTLGVLHFLAIFFYFYWTFWWFDTFMHLLGGLSIGLFLMWLFSRLGVFGSGIPLKQKAIVVILSSVAVIGVAWEVFEYVFDIAVLADESYVQDTFTDLVADLVGAYAAVVLGRKELFYIGEDNV